MCGTLERCFATLFLSAASVINCVGCGISLIHSRDEWKSDTAAYVILSQINTKCGGIRERVSSLTLSHFFFSEIFLWVVNSVSIRSTARLLQNEIPHYCLRNISINQKLKKHVKTCDNTQPLNVAFHIPPSTALIFPRRCRLIICPLKWLPVCCTSNHC